MNYFPFHLGDYAAHTAHLEPLEDLAYRRMLDAYYLREAPLPESVAEVARIIRLRQNISEIESVLSEFFVLTDDGWRHARCDEEIDRMQDKQAKARASAAASVNARKAKAKHPLSDGMADVERTLNERSTDVELPTPTPTPSISTSEDVDGQERGSVTQCPHQEIIALWADKLPSAIQPREWTPARSQALKTRWREKKNRQTLEWWSKFFEYVSKSDFLMGRSSSGSRRPFELSIEWLLKQENFVKVIEGRYHGAAGEEAQS